MSSASDDPRINDRLVALRLLRVAVAALLFIHGAARWYSGGVAPFGQFLEAKGLPLGLVIAWAITVFELAGTILLALGRLVPPISLGLGAIYATGIALVHWPAGWFVVGLGRNGMEYSVLLLVCLAVLGWSHRRPAG